MENFAFYRICYKTLSGKNIETNIVFKRYPDALIYANKKNSPQINWGAEYYVKKENIVAYSSFNEAIEKDSKTL